MNRKVYLSVLFLVLLSPIIPLTAISQEAAGNPQASTEVASSTEVVSSTAVVDSTKTIEVKPRVAKPAQKIPPQKKAQNDEEEHELTSGHGHVSRETGDITIHNDKGLQAIFINSDVAIHGGEFQVEVHNTESVESETVEADEEEKPGNGGAPSERRPGREREREEESEYAKLIKDATKMEGLLTVYEKADKLYFEILPEYFDQNFLMAGALGTGVGVGYMQAGYYLGKTIFTFKKINDKIHLVQRNLRFLNTDDPMEERSIARNYSESLIAAIPYEATNPENEGYMIEVSKIFMGDFFTVARELAQAVRGGYGLDPSSSYLKSSKSYPENVIIRTHFNFRSGSASLGSIVFPDARSVQLDVIYDIRRLKENPDFDKRLADPRVGYFTEAVYDFGFKEERADPFVKFISKWDIRKASPEAEISEPDKPIVIWIENTVPLKYREPIRRGILEWNKAFEKIGIRNAIQVHDQPKDATWDASDARYNTVQWNSTFDSPFAGSSQWLSNPGNGEILNGGFFIDPEVIRYYVQRRQYWQPDREDEGQKPVNTLKEEFKQLFETKSPKDLLSHPQSCSFARGLQDQIKTQLITLAAREGISRVTGEAMDKLIDDHLFAVAAHEMGHVLGLRHNFEGSTHAALETIRSATPWSEKSISASIMDYVPMILAGPGEKQGPYFEQSLGEYDYFAIEYGYKEVKSATGESKEEAIRKLANKAEQGHLRYGPDEDLYQYGGIDPLTQTFDLGDDPLKYAKEQSRQIQETIPLLPRLVDVGDDYYFIRDAFEHLISSYFTQATRAIPFIGGQYFRHIIKESTAARELPLDPVSPGKQREALRFLTDTLFSDEIFKFDPNLLNMLAGERGFYIGLEYHIGGETPTYPLVENVATYYDVLLYYIHSPRIMRTILESEQQRSDSAVDFTIPEVFKTVTGSVWKELDEVLADLDETPAYTNSNPMISAFRRALQRQHLKLMIQFMLEPPFGTPEDARTQAWRSLVTIRNKLQKISGSNAYDALDDYSSAHLEESLQKVNRALEAHINAQVDLF
jgi:hypothetical protein